MLLCSEECCALTVTTEVGGNDRTVVFTEIGLNIIFVCRIEVIDAFVSLSEPDGTIAG